MNSGIGSNYYICMFTFVETANYEATFNVNSEIKIVDSGDFDNQRPLRSIELPHFKN